MTILDDEAAENCSTPIAGAALSDYWIAALSRSEEETVEAHLLACDSCSTRLREVIDLAEGLRALAQEGRLRLVVSDAFLRRLEQDGATVRQYAVPAGGSVNCTVSAEDNLVVGRLATDLLNAQRVDLSICDERGIERFRRPDIPVRAGSSDVIFHETTAFLKAAPTFTMVVRLVAVDAAGERPLGEYTFIHTRTLPGPGAWL